MGYGIVQAIKIKSVVIMGDPVAHATHPTPWNAGFRFTKFFRELLDMLPRSGNRHSHGILLFVIVCKFFCAQWPEESLRIGKRTNYRDNMQGVFLQRVYGMPLNNTEHRLGRYGIDEQHSLYLGQPILQFSGDVLLFH